MREASVDGMAMLVRADDDVGRQIYFSGQYEPRESKYLKSVIQETDTCIDVGANIGYFSLLLARLATHGNVHSFEPVPMNLQMLNLNVLLNAAHNVAANGCALADFAGREVFTVSMDSAYSSFRDTGRKPVKESLSVEVTTLDNYCETKHLSKVDFVKIDVEGAEEQVLIGASRLLNDPQRRPRLLMLELYEPMLQGYCSGIDQIVDRLRVCGYAPYVCEHSDLVPFEPKHRNIFYNVFFELNCDPIR